MSSFLDNNTCVLSCGTFVLTKCIAGNTFTWTGLWDCFHSFIMMQFVLKSLLSSFLHGLWALVFTFLKVWAHICHCFVLIENRLDINIYSPGFQSILQNKNLVSFSDVAQGHHSLILKVLYNNHLQFEVLLFQECSLFVRNFIFLDQ